jgi:hypothetical protein
VAQAQTTYPRINIYLDDPTLREQIKIAAAHNGVTISAYCVDAIRQRLLDDGMLPTEANTDMQTAAQALDRLRHRIGPIGVPVRDLIAEGRR